MDKKQEAVVKTVVQDPGEKVQSHERANIFPSGFMGAFADEVAKRVFQRLPKLPNRTKKKTQVKSKTAQNGFFFDTSAIIDGRIFDVIKLGFLSGSIVILDTILLELKHIADSKDPLKKERGRKALENLSKIKKAKGVKVIEVPIKIGTEGKEVDEQLIQTAKSYKGKVITCDYNLEKKATVSGVTAINMHALAQMLKVAAIPGELLQVKLLHVGKDATQGVGYLDDGTMIVVEKASDLVGKEVSVKISRVIQTASGKILFARKEQQ